MEGAVFLLPFGNHGALTGGYFYVNTVEFNFKPQTLRVKKGMKAEAGDPLRLKLCWKIMAMTPF